MPTFEELPEPVRRNIQILAHQTGEDPERLHEEFEAAYSPETTSVADLVETWSAIASVLGVSESKARALYTEDLRLPARERTFSKIIHKWPSPRGRVFAERRNLLRWRAVKLGIIVGD